MIHCGDCLDILKTLPDNSVDSMVTDPPAGIAFMNKSWDADKGGRDQWIDWMKEIMQECLRVMKPGAHGLIWALPRTSHWTATALEDAGFEVRDIVNHVFGSGFPKSLNISKAIDKMKGAEREVIKTLPPGSGPLKRGHVLSTGGGMSVGTERSPEIQVTISSTPEAKQWDGFGTALKPAHENWILVRKPLENKTVAENVLEWGCGGINIDASRISGTKRHPGDYVATSAKITSNNFGALDRSDFDSSQGRFPANFILTEGVAVEELDRQSGISSSNARKRRGQYSGGSFGGGIQTDQTNHDDSGGASRFFYIAKASKKDKNEGCEGLELKRSGMMEDDNYPIKTGSGNLRNTLNHNSHPTVKNTKLMSYLITLVTPPKGVVIDPFMGSGSTGVAALRDGFEFIGIEKESEYFEIAMARIEHVSQTQFILK
jgi:DNA modification methylase